MKKLLKIFVLVLTLASLTYSQIGSSLSKNGTTAAQFLKIGVGTRAIGMGGAFTAQSGDIGMLYWNPAGIAQIYSREAMFNHIDWLMDVSYDYAGFAMNLADFGTVGAFVSVLGMEDMMVRTIEKPEGTGEFFSAGSMLIGLSYARNLTDNFSIGGSFKYIREHIWNESSTGFAIDVGVLYKIQILNEFRLGASISNFGTKMKMEGRDALRIIKVGSGEGNIINTEVELDKFDLPLIFRIGVAADLLKMENHRITTAIDALHPNDNNESINSGVEYSYNELFFIRAGYKSLFEKNSEQGLTLGAGVSYQIIESVRANLDYAYQDFGLLKNVHHLTLGIKF